MSRSSKIPTRPTWAWRRWIQADQQDLWADQLSVAKVPPAVFIESPGRSRVIVEVYSEQRREVSALARQFGGRTRLVKASEWLRSASAPPVRIGKNFEIVHEKMRKLSALSRLYIPHGVAFGSGDHATTLMLLRALTRHENWAQTAVLDLGTGSGVLALTARLFGARKIVATDFDPDAVRTARQNELLNFPAPLIRWQCADVKRLRAKPQYELVVANLFSEILCQAASQIAGSVRPGGQLWLSGILRSQKEEVLAAYRRQGMQLVRAVSRGKWVMLQWKKGDSGI
jgi:ribosomal protein L11 methyltransferase